MSNSILNQAVVDNLNQLNDNWLMFLVSVCANHSGDFNSIPLELANARMNHPEFIGKEIEEFILKSTLIERFTLIKACIAVIDHRKNQRSDAKYVFNNQRLLVVEYWCYEFIENSEEHGEYEE